MRNCTEHILNGVNGLVNIDFTHGFVVVTTVSTAAVIGFIKTGWYWCFAFGKFDIAG